MNADILALSQVTLHVRVWIEIYDYLNDIQDKHVTLHVMVWIEIGQWSMQSLPPTRHPPREGVD